MRYSQVKELIVTPVLNKLSFSCTPESVELMLMTMGHESLGGEFIEQVGGGPALGVYQMEVNTYEDIWDNYLRYNGPLAQDVYSVLGHTNAKSYMMVGNLYFATVMARMHYRRVREAIPAREDFGTENTWLRALASYAKIYYNTYLGKATPQEYLDDYLNWMVD